MTELERMPPQAVEVEQAVIGAMLISKRALVHAMGSLDEEDFYHAPHARIFRAALDVWRFEGAVDQLVVGQFLKGAGLLDQVGGYVYLAELASGIASDANIHHHCRIVKDAAIARRGIEKAAELREKLFRADPRDASGLLMSFGSELLRQTDAKEIDTGIPVSEVASAAASHYERAVDLRRRGIAFVGLDSGVHSVNLFLNGINGEEMTAIGARPSIGKTTLAWQIGLNLALQGHHVAAIPLESSRGQVGRLLTRILAKLPAEPYRVGALSKADDALRKQAEQQLAILPITILDKKPMTLGQVLASMAHVEARQHVDFWIIDYLQLILNDGSDGELNKITSALRVESLSAHTHVCLLSQLSRKPEERPTKRPQQADLRGSGGIEQDANNVLLIHRPGYYGELIAEARKKDLREPGTLERLLRHVELIFCKTREGPTGSTRPDDVRWDAETATFFDDPRKLEREAVQEELDW